jgi:Glycosyl transferase family 90
MQRAMSAATSSKRSSSTNRTMYHLRARSPPIQASPLRERHTKKSIKSGRRHSFDCGWSRQPDAGPRWAQRLWNNTRTMREYLLPRWKQIVVFIFVYAILSKSYRVYVRSTWVPRYDTYQDAQFRSRRFPSVEQRVKLYLSNWYLPPCPDSDAPYITYSEKKPYFWDDAILENTIDTNENEYISLSPEDMEYYELHVVHRDDADDAELAVRSRTMMVTNEVEIGRFFYADAAPLLNCSQQMNWSIHFYCSDTLQSILEELPNLEIWNDSHSNSPPILVQFSDETESIMGIDMADHSKAISNPDVPHFKKIRYALSNDDLDRLVRRPVLYTDQDDDVTSATACDASPRRQPPTGMDHLQPILWLLNEDRHFEYAKTLRRYDRPWEEKQDRAVFRGMLTGLQYEPGNEAGYICYQLLRCRLVQDYYHSTLVDARLTDTMGKVPEMMHGMNLTGDHLWKEDLLAYKGIIVLEGNDVASGLKWAMVSNSVVLMPPPTFTSWMMEELLEPWVHYIPLAPDLSDVEDKVRWMLGHDAEAQRISRRARLWILDLYFHPDAAADQRRINQEVLQRYRAHFRAAEEG